MMNQMMNRIFIAKLVCEESPRIRVEPYEVLAMQKGSLVIQRANDVRRFQQRYLGRYNTPKERYQEEGYGKTPEEAVSALRRGLQNQAAIFMHLAKVLRTESELPYGSSHEMAFKSERQ